MLLVARKQHGQLGNWHKTTGSERESTNLGWRSHFLDSCFLIWVRWQDDDCSHVSSNGPRQKAYPSMSSEVMWIISIWPEAGPDLVLQYEKPFVLAWLLQNCHPPTRGCKENSCVTLGVCPLDEMQHETHAHKHKLLSGWLEALHTCLRARSSNEQPTNCPRYFGIGLCRTILGVAISGVWI